MITAPVTTINPYWDEMRSLLERNQAVEPADCSFDESPRSLMTSARRLLREVSTWDERERCCRQYCWAVPDPASCAFVAQWLSLRAVEIGAGTGYWAWQIAQMGVDIVAYDEAPPDQAATNHWHSPRDAEDRFIGELRACYFPLQVGGPEQLTDHADRALFLCWPPFDSPILIKRQTMASACLTAYRGRRLVYIGEGQGGCTGDDTFFEDLGNNWVEVAQHRPVQWVGVHDWIRVYERRQRKGRK